MLVEARRLVLVCIGVSGILDVAFQRSQTESSFGWRVSFVMVQSINSFSIGESSDEGNSMENPGR